MNIRGITAVLRTITHKFDLLNSVARNEKNNFLASYNYSTMVLGPVTRLSDEEISMREVAKVFSQSKLKTYSKTMEFEKKISNELLSTMFRDGFMSINIPLEFGGSGCKLMTTILVIEELSKVDPSVAILVDIQNTLINTLIMRIGNEEQKQKYLPLLSKEWVGSFCLSESTSGSDAFSLRTQAIREKEHYIINGSKMWISNADIANIFIIFANTEPSRSYRGITCFLIERNIPGLRISEPENKLGLIASGTCEVILEDLRIPKENVLGEVGKGYKYAIEFLNEGRIGIAAQMLGICQGCFDATIEYAFARKQFNKEIFSFQSVQHQLAHLDTELECAKLLVYNTTRRAENGLDIMREASITKYYTAELAQRLTSKCIDLMGAVAFTKEYPHEKFYRDCKIGTIYEGTSNIQLNTIAKFIRKQYCS